MTWRHFDWCNSLFLVSLSALLVSEPAACAEEEGHCSRYHSRIVRNVLREHFYPVYEEHNVAVPVSCLLHQDRDMYIRQEMRKLEEHSSRWMCDICGKTFYNEESLDLHLDNRHSDYLVKDSHVCLADYCDIFRCTVLDDHRKDRFWEKALCKKEKIMVLKRRCEVLIHGCLPTGNSTSKSYKVYERVWRNICSHLTCKDYWKPPYEEMATWRIILYAVFSPFFVMGLIVYYYCAWEYYYGDLFHDTTSAMEERSPRYVRSWQREGHLRQRHHLGSIHMY